MAGRATIRVRVPKGWARGLVAGVEAAFAGWAITTVTTMIVYLSLRSNTWMSDTLPRDALALGGDLWVATLGVRRWPGSVLPCDSDAFWCAVEPPRAAFVAYDDGVSAVVGVVCGARVPPDRVVSGGYVGGSFAVVDGYGRRDSGFLSLGRVGFVVSSYSA